jgi:large subunit ribosomal protein L9
LGALPGAKIGRSFLYSGDVAPEIRWDFRRGKSRWFFLVRQIIQLGEKRPRFLKELGMKVILNKDLATLGEEGDVRDVAKGYARNYLFPRGIALPYTEQTIKLFESRREEIEARKENKRKDAMGLKEKLESLELTITMPAGANGKLYGAVTSQTVADELAKQGHQIERKRIELAGTNFKSVGKYKATVKLYESAAAEITINVQGQEIKTETPSSAAKGRRHEGRKAPAVESAAEDAAAASAETAPGSAATPAAAGEAVPADTGSVEAPAENPGTEDTGAGETAENSPAGDTAAAADATAPGEAPETAAARE